MREYNKNEVEEMKKLIKHGFDLELIAFEFDIPIEQVKQWKLEIENNQKSNGIKIYSAKEIIDNENKQAHLKMEQIREEYRRLYSRDNNTVKTKSKLSLEDVALINEVIAKAENILGEMKDASKEEKRSRADNILKEINKIQDKQLTISQAERLYELLQSEELDRLNLRNSDKINIYIENAQRTMVRKLTEAINCVQEQTEDVSKLKELKRKLTMKLQKENQMVVGSLRNKIEHKISKITQQSQSNKIKNNIPANVEKITKELANGTLDVQDADGIISKEARKITENKPKNKFALTEEQEKRQILIQIRSALRNNPEQYQIDNPEITIKKLQELSNGSLEQSVKVVVKNLTGRKEFERAKEVCDQFKQENPESAFLSSINRIKKEIRNDEIGDIVLKGINMNGTYEEEKAYLRLVEKGIRRGNVKLESISLGKSKDGLRTITLADVWPGEKYKGSLR